MAGESRKKMQLRQSTATTNGQLENLDIWTSRQRIRMPMHSRPHSPSPPISLPPSFPLPPSLTHSLSPSLTRSLARSLTPPPSPRTHTPIHSITHSLTHPRTRTLTHSLTRICLSSFVLQKKPENINGELLGYIIQYKKTNESNFRPEKLSGPATSHELSSLEDATEYDVRVMVYNDKGNGPASNVTTVRTLGGEE